MEQREQENEKNENNYQVPRNDDTYNDILPSTRPYPSVYHYNERNQNEIYHI